MTNAKDANNNKNKPPSLNKLPPQGYSRFGKGPAYGIQKIQARGQFKPPAPRITQNKGGGGK